MCLKKGQERDIIILCTTRTTGVGFLANLQRLNVALTRAKKCLVICGNFTSISVRILEIKKSQNSNNIILKISHAYRTQGYGQSY